MKNYIPKSKKSNSLQTLINEALDILEIVGIPVDAKTERSRERMAVCFLAVAGVTKNWNEAKSSRDGRHLKTRDIIKFVNEHYEEKISPGSYDDIRRKDLKLLVLADLVINSGENPSAATNDPTRGNSIHPNFRDLIVSYKTNKWQKKLKEFTSNRESL